MKIDRFDSHSWRYSIAFNKWNQKKNCRFKNSINFYYHCFHCWILEWIKSGKKIHNNNDDDDEQDKKETNENNRLKSLDQNMKWRNSKDEMKIIEWWIEKKFVMKETKKKWKKPKDSSFIHLFVHPFTGPLNLIINEKKNCHYFIVQSSKYWLKKKK